MLATLVVTVPVNDAAAVIVRGHLCNWALVNLATRVALAAMRYLYR